MKTCLKENIVNVPVASTLGVSPLSFSSGTRKGFGTVYFLSTQASTPPPGVGRVDGGDDDDIGVSSFLSANYLTFGFLFGSCRSSKYSLIFNKNI